MPQPTSEGWKSEETRGKESRVDPKAYQADLQAAKRGSTADLAQATVSVQARCRYRGNEPGLAATIDDFMQFVHSFTREESHNTNAGP